MVKKRTKKAAKKTTKKAAKKAARKSSQKTKQVPEAAEAAVGTTATTATAFVQKRILSQQVVLLHELAMALTSSLDVEEVLQTIMSKVEQLLSPDTWSLLLVDEDASELSFQIVKGEGSERLKGVRFQMNQGIAGWVAMHGEAVVVPDVTADPRFWGEADEITQQKTHSLVCVPVVLQERTLGVIEILNFHGHRDFDEYDMELLQALADYVAIALQNAFHMKKIHELTITDDLTGLFNSRQYHNILERELNRAKRYAFQFSLLFIDLDHFKQVNDTHGHLVGSGVLQEVGEVVKESLRDSDFGFRYGGDEFVLLLPHTDNAGAVLIGKRIQEKMAQKVFATGHGLELKVAASMGVASYPADAETKEDLVRLADEAMYHVKNTTRDGVAVAGDRTVK
jgi:diguanylate cyclase (GGDEF)-like protein